MARFPIGLDIAGLRQTIINDPNFDVGTCFPRTDGKPTTRRDVIDYLDQLLAKGTPNTAESDD